MKTSILILMGCFLLAGNKLATAAATAETAAAAKAKAAEVAAQEIADTATAEAKSAEEAAAIAAVAAAKAAAEAAAATKAAAVAKIARAKAAVAKAKEKAAAAKKATAAAARGGARSCEEWKQERASKSGHGLAASWLSGFLSGIALARNQDFLSDTNTKSLYASVDEYCNLNPLEYVSDAGIYLYLERARKKGLIE